jgi:CheY-like chemotaxis protein
MGQGSTYCYRCRRRRKMWRILLVDDSEDQLKINEGRLSLSEAQYDIRTVTSVDEAIEMINTEEFDVVVTDLMMPSRLYEGFKVIKAVRQKDPGFTRTKVIVLTVVGSKNSEEGFDALRLAMQQGVSDYIVKGWDRYTDMLDITIQKILQEPQIVTVNRDQVFIACPYDSHHNQICEKLKKKASNSSFQISRADDMYGGDYLKEIVYKLIATSEYVVAFISGLNSNVMYELGLAHGMRKKVIIVKDNATSISSDLSGIQIINYDRNAYLNIDEDIFNALLDFSPDIHDDPIKSPQIT